MFVRRNRVCIALAVLNLWLSTNGWAKCPTELVDVRGNLKCSVKPNYKVLVTLIYQKKQLEGFGQETALDIRDDSFEGRIKFDTFTSYNSLTGHHQCDRRPTSVLIRFISAEGEEWDRKTLSFHNDFMCDEKDDQYKLRTRLTLQGWCQP